MGSKAKISEPNNLEINNKTGESNGLENSLIDSANKYLELKISEGIPITQSFRKLFYLNFIESKNLELSWRKTSGN